MDANATNYNSDAEVDDSSCEYPEPVKGCMDVNATNYNSTVVIDDDSCEYLEEPSGFCPTEITDENKDTVDDACIVPVDETEDPESNNEDEGLLPSISLFTAICAVAIIAFRRR